MMPRGGIEPPTRGFFSYDYSVYRGQGEILKIERECLFLPEMVCRSKIKNEYISLCRK
jgi:hypothetical protein